MLVEQLAADQLGRAGVVDGEPLELEEAQAVLGVDEALLDRGVGIALGLAGDVRREREAREAPEPREAVVERLEL